MKRHPLRKAVAYALRVNKMQLDSKNLKNITNQLLKAGFSETVKDSEVFFVIKSVANIGLPRHNPLKTTASVRGGHLQDCPLCVKTASPSISFATVKLADGRRAKYCIEHSVTIPYSIED